MLRIAMRAGKFWGLQFAIKILFSSYEINQERN